MCDREDCMNKATGRVTLILRHHPKHEPATAQTEVYVCNDHADVKWEEFVSEEGWRVICNSFKERGFAVPSKKHSKLKVVPL
jgi:hypothetical protein